ncbi:MAG: alkaline phosphatase family protein [bacterium]|nr:alkaline phosphatase family protein [bacterium]
MKMLVLGIDGADWKFIIPLIQQGKLPNLKKLRDSGASGPLLTQKPPMSPVVWTTIMTGKVREKHNIINFYSNSGDLNSYRIWDILNKNGIPSGTMSHLLTNPPDEKLLFQIPGWMSTTSLTVPEEYSIFKEWERKKKIPRNIIWILKNLSLRSIFALLKFRKNIKTKHKHPLYYLADEMVKGDIFKRLVKRFKPQFSSIMFYGTDFMSHKYIHQVFPDRFTPELLKKLGDCPNYIEQMYMLVDKKIGEILKLFPLDKTNFIAVSDHGFNPAMPEKAFKYRLKGRPFISVIGKKKIKDFAVLGYVLNVFAEKKILEKLMQEIDAVTITENGKKLFKCTMQEDKLLVEFKTEFMTITSDINKMHFKFRNKEIPINRIVGQVKRPGTHAKHGIFIASGPIFKQGYKFKEAGIQDVTPTILHSFGLPVGKDMDGKVLTEIFKDEFISNNPVKFIDTHDSDFKKKELKEKTDMKELKKRLEELGYI